MSAAEPAAGDQQVFVLRSAPPVRGLAISAVAMVVGAVVLVAAAEFGWPPALSWLGLMIMVLGAVVGIAAQVSARRLRSEIVLRTSGITVSGARGRHLARWSDIAKVTSLDGQLLLLPKQDDGREIMIVNPRGAGDPTYLALIDAIRQRMDNDRGYRNL